jgi:Fe2+ transport system protein FeoA
MLSLSEVKMGKMYKICGISSKAPFKIKRRLLELGFTSGQKVCVERKSLLGQAFLVQVRGFMLSMRKDIVNYILVE